MLEPCQVSISHNLLRHLLYVYDCTYLNNAKTIQNLFFNKRAPPGCLQYFYGSSRHTFTSFNWDGTSSCSSGCLIKDQAYTICFRPERGNQK